MTTETMTMSPVEPMNSEPPRCGRLRHGNRSGNPHTAPRCGARNRLGLPCRAPALRGKARCRLHGGHSTGPTTLEGLARLRAANTKHGRFSAAGLAVDRWRRQYVSNGYRTARALGASWSRLLAILDEGVPDALLEEQRTAARLAVSERDAHRLVTLGQRTR